jgi:hypothetical protein
MLNITFPYSSLNIHNMKQVRVSTKAWQFWRPRFVVFRYEVGAYRYIKKVGLRRLEVAFPPHDPSDGGSIPAEVVEFFRAEKFGNEVLRKGL